jgi:hypothetical protein
MFGRGSPAPDPRKTDPNSLFLPNASSSTTSTMDLDLIHQKGGSGPRFTKLVEHLRGALPNPSLVELEEITHHTTD